MPKLPTALPIAHYFRCIDADNQPAGYAGDWPVCGYVYAGCVKPAIAPALLSAELLANRLRLLRAGYRNYCLQRDARDIGRRPHSENIGVLLDYIAALEYDREAYRQNQAGHELDCAALTARAEKAEARVKEMQAELAEQERAKLLLIQETHRWSAAVKKLEAERVAPVGEHELGEWGGCDNCGHTDWEAYKPGLGCNLCEGL